MENNNKMNESNKTTHEEADSTSEHSTVNNNQLKGDNTVKDPDDWTTGDEPMTGAQKSYLKTLSDEAGVDFDETLSKAEASKSIDMLQKKTGRGLKENS